MIPIATTFNLGSEQAFGANVERHWSFPIRISSVNVARSAVSCGFVTFTEENLPTYTEGKIEILHLQNSLLLSIAKTLYSVTAFDNFKLES